MPRARVMAYCAIGMVVLGRWCEDVLGLPTDRAVVGLGLAQELRAAVEVGDLPQLKWLT